MSRVLFTVAFAMAILISVSLHEAGHLITAKRFGMRVTSTSLRWSHRHRLVRAGSLLDRGPARQTRPGPGGLPEIDAADLCGRPDRRSLHPADGDRRHHQPDHHQMTGAFEVREQATVGARYE